MARRNANATAAPAAEKQLVPVDLKDTGLVRKYDVSIASGKGSYHVADLHFHGSQIIECDEEVADLIRGVCPDAFTFVERLYREADESEADDSAENPAEGENA